MSDSSPRILVVDDEAPIRRFLHLTLTARLMPFSKRQRDRKLSPRQSRISPA